jgi:hypothetical protein
MPTTSDRFVFEKRPIGDWLLQLVDEDSAKRKTAANVLTDRFYMPVDLLPDTERGVELFLAEFSAAVRMAVGQPGFPAKIFVRDLLELELALHASWCAKVGEDSARENEADKADLEKLGENPSDAAKERYARRVWIRFFRDCKKLDKEEPHEIFSTGMAVVRVIESLGAELLPAADILREMLFSKNKAHLASDAIARMGRPGLEFYGDLFEGLKRNDPNFVCSQALGALLKVAPEKILEVLQLACESEGGTQIAAISAFAACGKAATEAFPEVETGLRNILLTNPEDRVWYSVVHALGRCAGTTETVNILLAHLNSADLGKSSEAILALGNMGIEGERVVPRITEMLDTFEEYDPDWCYNGEHERVAQALRGFGSLAASAIPTLIRHVWTKPQQYWTSDQILAQRPEPDQGVIKLLGELGVLAKGALPILSEVRDEMRRRSAEANTPDDAETSVAGDEDTYWVVAINRIQGDSPS